MIKDFSIRIQNLKKDFASKQVFANLNIDIQKSSFVSLVGPSGCGKSTLLRLIAGLDDADEGSIENSHQSIGFVFQDPQLLQWRTVAENIRLVFELQKESLSSVAQDDLIRNTLKTVHLEDAFNLFPHELSGGMKMRVSLARALIKQPDLLLLDEPFAALDENTRFEMQNLLLQICTEKKMTVLFVTHSLFEAAYLSQRVLLLKNGSIQLDKTIDLPFPREEYLRTSPQLNLEVENLGKALRI